MSKDKKQEKKEEVPKEVSEYFSQLGKKSWEARKKKLLSNPPK